MSDLGQTRDWKQRCEAAEARVTELERHALLAGSLLDWCIGYLDQPGYERPVLGKLQEARATLAAKEGPQ